MESARDLKLPRGSDPPEDLATLVAAVFGQVELVFVNSDDLRIPASLQITDEHAAGLRWAGPKVIAAVVCGHAPQSLHAIVFSDEKQFTEFKEANPALIDTLVTWWPLDPENSINVLWLRCSDGIAKDVSCGPLTWVGTGVVPVAIAHLETKHFIRKQGPIAEVKFSEIKWPPEMKNAFDIGRLEESFGPRYTCIGGNKTILNGTFWASFVAQRTGLTFVVDKNAFSVSDNGAVQVPDENVLLTVMQILRKASTVDYGFPSANLRPAMAKKIVEEMKLVTALLLPGKKEALDEYLDTRVEKCFGHSLTVLELYSDYRDFCEGRRFHHYPPTAFQRLIADVLEKKFGVMKSHDIERPGNDGLPRARRGFHALSLKDLDQEMPADVSDVAGGADTPDGTVQPSKLVPNHQPEKVVN
jgi:hypothetical protein